MAIALTTGLLIGLFAGRPEAPYVLLGWAWLVALGWALKRDIKWRLSLS